MTAFTPYRPLKTVSLLAIVGLALMAVGDFLSVLLGIAQVVSPETAIDLEEEGLMSVWLMFQGLIFILRFPTYVFTVVMFLIWLHRASSNLPALQSKYQQFTPGWAVGWWFLPFANLVKPFQVVREVWWESDPETALDDEPTFLSESMHSAPFYMGLWWGMWIVSNIAANVAGNVYNPDKMDNIEGSGIVFIVSGILSMIAAGLAIMVVRDISNRQAERFARLSARGFSNELPPPPPSFGATQ